MIPNRHRIKLLLQREQLCQQLGRCAVGDEGREKRLQVQPLWRRTLWQHSCQWAERLGSVSLTTGAAPQTWTFDLQFAEYRPQFDLIMAFVRKRFAADRAMSALGHTGLNLLIYDHLLHLFQDLLAFGQRKAGGFRP